MLGRAVALALVLAGAPAVAQTANPPPYLPDDGPGSAFPRRRPVALCSQAPAVSCV